MIEIMILFIFYLLLEFVTNLIESLSEHHTSKEEILVDTMMSTIISMFIGSMPLASSTACNLIPSIGKGTFLYLKSLWHSTYENFIFALNKIQEMEHVVVSPLVFAVNELRQSIIVLQKNYSFELSFNISNTKELRVDSISIAEIQFDCYHNNHGICS